MKDSSTFPWEVVMSEERFVGCLLGVALGDALGAPFEKMTAGEIAKVPGAGETFFDGSVNPKPFPGNETLRLGEWTDDTQLTLAVAKALLPDGNLDMKRMAGEHVKALKQATRGWGGTTRRAVEALAGGTPWAQSAQKPGGGNGVMMKIAPLGLISGHRIDQQGLYDECRLAEDSLALGGMTHGHPGALLAGVMQALFIAELMTLRGNDASQAYSFAQLEILIASEEKKLESEEFTAAMQKVDELVALGRRRRVPLDPEFIAGHFGGGTKEAFTAWNSLGTAYTCFLLHPHNPMLALREVICCGGDTDSNASIVGALLGALRGPNIFPSRCLDVLDQTDLIEQTARKLYAAASKKQ